jgi:hypothetical protein
MPITMPRRSGGADEVIQNSETTKSVPIVAPKTKRSGNQAQSGSRWKPIAIDAEIASATTMSAVSPKRCASRGTKGTTHSVPAPANAVLMPEIVPETPIRSISMPSSGTNRLSDMPTSVISRIAAPMVKRLSAAALTPFPGRTGG